MQRKVKFPLDNASRSCPAPLLLRLNCVRHGGLRALSSRAPPTSLSRHGRQTCLPHVKRRGMRVHDGLQIDGNCPPRPPRPEYQSSSTLTPAKLHAKPPPSGAQHTIRKRLLHKRFAKDEFALGDVH